MGQSRKRGEDLKKGNEPRKLVLTRLPVGVLDPCRDLRMEIKLSTATQRGRKREKTYVLPRPPDDFLKLLPLSTAVLVKLLEVLNALLRLGYDSLLEVGGFTEELLGGNLRKALVSFVLTRGRAGGCGRTCTAAGARFFTRPAPSRPDIVEGRDGGDGDEAGEGEKRRLKLGVGRVVLYYALLLP